MADEIYAVWGRSYGLTVEQAKTRLKLGLEREVASLKASRWKSIAKVFLKKAREDVETAGILYQKGVYSLALFHLQQAVEKTGKAILYLHGVYSAKSHSTIEVYELWYDAIWKETQRKASEGSRDYPTYNNRIIASAATRTTQIFIRVVDRRYKEQPELFSVLFGKSKFKWSMNKVNANLTRYFDKRQNKIRKLSKDDIQELLSDTKSILNADLAIELAPEFRELLESTEMIFALTLITVPHEQTTRYPSNDGSILKYDKGVGIIQEFQNLLKEIDAINKLWMEIAK
jgi:HEPN domain-containing protein